MKYIGIIGRENNNRITYNKEIIDIIYRYNCIPICISLNFKKNKLIQIKELIDLCNGFILQGGNKIYDIDIDIVKYLYDNDIPTLGICMGMQTMSLLFNGKLQNIDKHYSSNKYVHNIHIKNNTKLYNIIKKKKIKVNSRHHEIITKTDLDICTDNIIEAVEDKNKKFFIGVQWHPESILDNNSRKLFNCFFSSIK